MRYSTLPTIVEDLQRFALGFDTTFRIIEGLAAKSTNYPPYNIRQINQTDVMIEIAVAGFSKNEIDIVLDQGYLTVHGAKHTDDKVAYLYKGIADRTFVKQYALANTITIVSASIMGGILYILCRNTVSVSKPTKIEVSDAFPPSPELVQEIDPKLKMMAEETAEKL